MRYTLAPIAESLEVSHLVGRVQARLRDEGYAHVAQLSEDFDYAGFASQFGTPIQQYHGELVWDVRPTPDLDGVYDSRNTRALVPHTEGYEFDGLPPRFVVLWCVQAAAGEGGETLLADGLPFLDSLPSSDRALLRTRMFQWTSSEGLARDGVALRQAHPALDQRGSLTVMRFSENNVSGDAPDSDTALLSRYLRAGRKYFDEAFIGIRLLPGELLIWDNWRVLHSRSAFVDRRRHLKRMLIAA